MHVFCRDRSDFLDNATNDKNTYQDDMVVQLSLVFTFAVHFGHLFEALEHGIHDTFVRSVDDSSYLETVGTEKLAFDTSDVTREQSHEGSYTFTLLARQLCSLNTLDLLVLCFSSIPHQKAGYYSTYDVTIEKTLEACMLLFEKTN